jgi:hypothetical protein
MGEQHGIVCQGTWQTYVYCDVMAESGGGFENLHHSPVSCRRQRIGNPVSGGLNMPLYSWGI